MKPKAYSYVRFSSPEQARGDSYRRQKEAAEKFCEENGLELADSREYTFLDKGRSAYKAEHVSEDGQLKRFIDLVTSGAIPKGSYLLVESLDRLSRERVNVALERFIGILNSGINVYTLMDKRLYAAESKDISLELIASIAYMMKAHAESSDKASRVGSAWNQKKIKARNEGKPLGRACPYWLELSEDGYRPIPARVDVINRIYSLCINEGRGKRSICKILNDENVPVFGSKNRNRKELWSYSSIHKLLNNRALIGEYQPTKLENGIRVSDGPPIPSYYPTVISEDTFYLGKAAQTSRLIHKTTKQSRRYNVFQGIGFCGACGDTLNLINKGKPPKGYVYISCASIKKGRTSCDSKMLRIEKAEEGFKQILAKIDSLSLIQDNAHSYSQKIDKISAQIAIKRQKLLEAKALLKERMSLTLAGICSDLETEIKQLTEELDIAKTGLSTNKIIDKEEFFKRLDLESYEGRHAANTLIKRLEVKIIIESMLLSSGRRWFFTAKEKAPSVDSTEYNEQMIVEASTIDFDNWNFHSTQPNVSKLSVDQGDMHESQHREIENFSELNDRAKLAVLKASGRG